jgi:hypothetical protein
VAAESRDFHLALAYFIAAAALKPKAPASGK